MVGRICFLSSYVVFFLLFLSLGIPVVSRTGRRLEGVRIVFLMVRFCFSDVVRPSLVVSLRFRFLLVLSLFLLFSYSFSVSSCTCMHLSIAWPCCAVLAEACRGVYQPPQACDECVSSVYGNLSQGA